MKKNSCLIQGKDRHRLYLGNSEAVQWHLIELWLKSKITNYYQIGFSNVSRNLLFEKAKMLHRIIPLTLSQKVVSCDADICTFRLKKLK